MEERINLFNLKSDRIRTLHFTWFAFFISFYIWFNMAPLMASIRDAMDLNMQQVKVLMILNVALTIPSRIAVGMLVDKFGPRIMYTCLLFISGILCIIFAFQDTFERLAMMRFLLAFVGAGFVIGIRMIGEWFPHKQVGLAEGIYGGWGNFGSAGAALTIPTVAVLIASAGGGEESWRYAIMLSGCVAIVYSFIYYINVRDTPKGSTYFKPNKTGAMEVTTPSDFYLYLVMNIPLYLALAVLTWKLSPLNLGLLTEFWTSTIYSILVAIYIFQTYHVYRVNKDIFSNPVPEIHRYKFKQVAVLNLAYFCTFGSELAVVSMLPLFYLDTFDGMTQVAAGLIAASYAFVNLVARPGGGFFSDTFGRKKALIILIGGLSLGYFLMSLIDSGWPVLLAVVVTMFCSFFVMAGEGAVFSVVPLIKRRMTGQIAGMTGAFGNVGAVIYLTTLSFVDNETFFLVIGASALVIMVLVAIFLDEPKGQMAEVLPDGTVQMIDVG
ncbi:MAG: NarK family nitrate/nitrite MFS transporter [Thiomargarita sp.]|nr:NarK family nitrate/nitrite MFS transporter [Thiomargarita sp.]